MGICTGACPGECFGVYVGVSGISALLATGVPVGVGVPELLPRFPLAKLSALFLRTPVTSREISSSAFAVGTAGLDGGGSASVSTAGAVADRTAGAAARAAPRLGRSRASPLGGSGTLGDAPACSMVHGMAATFERAYARREGRREPALGLAGPRRRSPTVRQR